MSRSLLRLGLLVAFLSVPSTAHAASVSWSTPGTYDWTVPAGVTAIGVDLLGAAGGNGFGAACDECIAETSRGGAGGRTTGSVAVTPGAVVRVVVGGSGTNGGFNGGGTARTALYARSDNGAPRRGGAGGGATDVRVGGTELLQRVAIAGGGGGGAASSSQVSGGAGGGLSGLGGTGAGGGGGGTQIAGGTGTGDATTGELGTGGAAGVNTAVDVGGGGGGGLYGGGGGASATAQGGGGGGGSSLVPADGTTTVGGGSAANGSATITWSTSVPEPTGLAVSPASPSTSNAVTVSGTAPTGATVALYATADCTGTPVATGTTADFASGFALTVAADTTTRFSATATVDGTSSSCSAPVTYVEDSTAPAAPQDLHMAIASPANQNTVGLSVGTVEPAATVRIYTTPDCSGTPLFTVSGSTATNQGVQVTVADDTTTTYRATATDPAGNLSACSSDSATYVEDSTPPAAPGGFTFAGGNPGSDVTPDLSGSAETGSFVIVSASADCTGQAAGAVTASGGAFTLTVEAYGNAERTFTARAMDRAQNVSPCSAPVTYRHDNVAPDAPALVGLAARPGSRDGQAAATGTLTADAATVRLYVGDCTGTPAATGTAAAFTGSGIDVPTPVDTEVGVRATAVDRAGNASGCSNALTFTRRVPPPPVVPGPVPVPPVVSPVPPRAAPAPATPRLPLTVGRVRASSTGALELRGTAPGPGRLDVRVRAKGLVLGTRRVAITTAGPLTVRLTPSTSVRRRLRKASAAGRRAEVRVTFRPAGGAVQRLTFGVRLPAPGRPAAWRTVAPAR